MAINNKILLIVFTIVAFSSLSFAQNYSQYKPYPNDRFPQIIQASDYETIKFIEVLYSSLTKLDKDTMNCELQGNKIVFSASNKSSKIVTLQELQNNAVLLNNTKYSNKSIMILCSTLFRVLSDLTKESRIESVKYYQFQTSAYKKRTIIEFKLGNRVLVVESDSNGPKNDERLYILDIQDISDSFFWGAIK